ncbi:hypothetical protein F183_A47070 [Bryobacterales bacterium F-183]|nr:hypothetical protein F183_A47070 [Bryobacterales bacterium F-183]
MAIPNITIDGSDLISMVALQTKLRYWVLEKVMKEKKVSLTKQGKAAAKAGADAAKAYVLEVSKILGTILGTETGAIILSAISASGKKLVIRPYLELDANAWAWAEDFEFAVQKGHPLFIRDDIKATTFIDERLIPGTLADGWGASLADYVGTGEGSDSVLEFTPPIPGLGSSIPQSVSAKSSSLPGQMVDQILFHELTHVYRQTTGQQTRVPLVGYAQKYENTEEFFSILVSNIYISETGGTLLRADHGTGVLRPELTKPGAFFGDSPEGRSNRAALALTRIEPGIFRKLARVRSAPFNPLRDLMIESKIKDAMKTAKSFLVGSTYVRTYRP